MMYLYLPGRTNYYPFIFYIVRLLPFALPKKICSCDTENVSVSGGQKVILVNINGNLSFNISNSATTFSCLKCTFDLLVPTGRYDLCLPLLTCENCNCQWTPQLKDLVSNGYWPGTIDFHTVFDIDVFLTCEDLKISAPGLSRHAFILKLESRSVRAGRVMHIIDTLLQMCIVLYIWQMKCIWAITCKRTFKYYT